MLPRLALPEFPLRSPLPMNRSCSTHGAAGPGVPAHAAASGSSNASLRTALPPQRPCPLPSSVLQAPDLPFLRHQPANTHGASQATAAIPAITTPGREHCVQAFEHSMAQLEGGQAACAFASGTGAISATLFSLLRRGSRVVCVREAYADTSRLLRKLQCDHGIHTTFVDGADAAAIEAVLPGAAVLYLESPGSWTFGTQDLPRLAAAARALGVVTICDNSWATPLQQKPLECGIDLVLHASCQLLSGYSECMAGVVVGSQARIAAVRDACAHAAAPAGLHARLSAWDAWLLLHGMRTLDMRLRAQWHSCLLLQEQLAQHPAVARILHPAWQRGPGNHCLEGYASLFSLELRPGWDGKAFCQALRCFKRGVSWGGHQSLALPALVLAAGATPQTDVAGTADASLQQLVRLYIGFEDSAVLWQDLQQALHDARQQLG